MPLCGGLIIKGIRRAGKQADRLHWSPGVVTERIRENRESTFWMN
jgi:hypothetical protein